MARSLFKPASSHGFRTDKSILEATISKNTWLFGTVLQFYSLDKSSGQMIYKPKQCKPKTLFTQVLFIKTFLKLWLKPKK